jgi:hypothetical protein
LAGDGAAGVSSVLADAEAEMLIADRGRRDGLRRRHEKCDVRVAEPERRRQLSLGEAEREVGSRDDRVTVTASKRSSGAIWRSA